jgi:hypothetical protein
VKALKKAENPTSDADVSVRESRTDTFYIFLPQSTFETKKCADCKSLICQASTDSVSA